MLKTLIEVRSNRFFKVMKIIKKNKKVGITLSDKTRGRPNKQKIKGETNIQLRKEELKNVGVESAILEYISSLDEDY